MVRVLGPVEVTGLGAPLTSQQRALIAHLAGVGPAGRDALVEALWDGRPVSAGRFANLISATRQRLGAHHLPPASGGRYRLVDVVTDVDVLAEVADRPHPGEAALEAALGLVRGPVWSVPDDRWWRWLDSHPEVSARAEAVVGRLACRLVAELAAARRDDRAREVCERALAHCPLDRDLTLALEAVHRRQGRPVAAHRLVERWRRRVGELTGEVPALDQASRGTAVTTTLPR